MIYTSYFGNINNIIKADSHKKFVGISLYESKFVKIPVYEKKLAPKLTDLWCYKNNLITWRKYAYNYYDKLYNLEKKWLDDFTKNFEETVLLCFEKNDKNCHRRLLRNFINWYFGKEIIVEWNI